MTSGLHWKLIQRASSNTCLSCDFLPNLCSLPQFTFRDIMCPQNTVDEQFVVLRELSQENPAWLGLCASLHCIGIEEHEGK